MSSRFESQPDRIVSTERLYSTVWALSLAVALLGMIGVGLGPSTRPGGYALLAVGGGALALCSLSTEIRTAPAGGTAETLHLIVVIAGGLTFVVGVAVATDVPSWATPIPLAVRLVVLATAFQALLLTTDVRTARRNLRARAVTLGLSHGSIFAASARRAGTVREWVRVAAAQRVLGANALLADGSSPSRDGSPALGGPAPRCGRRRHPRRDRDGPEHTDRDADAPIAREASPCDSDRYGGDHRALDARCPPAGSARASVA